MNVTCVPHPREPIKLPELLPQFYYICSICGKAGPKWAVRLPRHVAPLLIGFSGNSDSQENSPLFWPQSHCWMQSLANTSCICASRCMRVWGQVIVGVGGWVHMLACASTELSVVCCLCGICHAKLSWLCKGICLCMLNLHASAAFWRDFKASERGRWPLQRILSLVELCKKYVQTLGLEYWKIGESVAQEIWMRELRTGRGL